MPELLPGEEWFLKAYWDLSTERLSSGTSVGRIPWSKVIMYGQHVGLKRTLVDHLWTIIACMDSGFLEWMKNEHDRHVRSQNNKGKTKDNSVEGKARARLN